MMNDEGIVVGVEHIPQLAKLSVENISKSHKNLLDSGKIVIVESDGREGFQNYSPFNVIHVGAGKINSNLAAPQVPKDLVDQLANNGRLVSLNLI
jgi:protein-L-isoaspartate(D-aspartate) O-methyltransferase